MGKKIRDCVTFCLVFLPLFFVVVVMPNFLFLIFMKNEKSRISTSLEL